MIYTDPTGHSVWFDQYLPLTDADKKGIAQCEKDYNKAKNDKQRATAHAKANGIRSQYVKIVTVNGKEYIDYSNEINKMVVKNAKEADTHADDSDMGLNWFRNQVDNDAPWDIKREIQWNDQLGVPYLGKDAGKFNPFVLNGKVIDAEKLGNMTYGYWGTAMGYSSELLFYGGASAKVGKVKALLIGPPYYGDDVEDHIYIQKGINWYNRR